MIYSYIIVHSRFYLCGFNFNWLLLVVVIVVDRFRVGAVLGRLAGRRRRERQHAEPVPDPHIPQTEYRAGDQ